MYATASPGSIALALTGLAASGLVEVLGMVFRRGTELRHDTEGLV
ncbi:hypothetical protein [Enemella dayhoffiae]|nr:hypothetical protein [Enemella dayhoffiae]